MSRTRPNDPRVGMLRERREEIVEALIRQEKYVDGDRKVPNLRHAALERQFNEVNKQIHVAEGKTHDSYKYQHDNRHERWVKTETRATERGTKTVKTITHIERPADRVIPFRDYRAGKALDSRARSASRSEGNYDRGDHVGHAYSMRAGSGPDDRSTHFPQNGKTNIKNWNDLDLEKQAYLKHTSTPYLVVETELHYGTHRYCGTRPYKVTQDIKDPHGNRPLGDRRIFSNPKDHSPGGPVPSGSPGKGPSQPTPPSGPKAGPPGPGSGPSGPSRGR